MAALPRLLKRASALRSNDPEYYVFPACEVRTIDPSRPQKSWRIEWRKLVVETARRVGREAAQQPLDSGKGLRGAIVVWKRVAAPIRGLRFHDLRRRTSEAMQPRAHGRQTHCAGKTGKRSDGRDLADESSRVEESELSLYVTIHVTMAGRPGSNPRTLRVKPALYAPFRIFFANFSRNFRTFGDTTYEQ
jgi:hypothetical protein